jgi:hypothetical protein
VSTGRFTTPYSGAHKPEDSDENGRHPQNMERESATEQEQNQHQKQYKQHGRKLPGNCRTQTPVSKRSLEASMCRTRQLHELKAE